MTDIEDPLQTLRQIRWLENLGRPEPTADVFGSVEEVAALLDSEPDRFFEPPYSDPYESLCLGDHNAAIALVDQSQRERAKAVAKQADLATWERIAHPELCGLISDDVETIASLLLIGEPLSAFTKDRLAWYERGRVPWGYAGSYPVGRWLIL